MPPSPGSCAASEMSPRALCFVLLSVAVCGPGLAQQDTDVRGCAAVMDLPAVEARAATANFDVQLARRAVDAADADVTTAGERPNPSLSLNSSAYDLRRGLGPGDALHKPSDTVLRFDQPIERGGKRRLRLDVARAGLAASEADYAEQKRESLMTARTAFYALVRAQHRVAIEREIEALQQQTLDAAEARQRAGDLSASDLARLRLEALRAANERERSEADQRAAAAALAVLLGCGPAANADAPVLRAEGALPAPIDPGSADARDAPALRADVAAAEARARQAHSALELAEAQRTRDISVGVQLEHYPGGVPAPGDGQLLAGLGITVPLFVFNRYDGEIARARADRTSRLTELARTRALAEADLAQARDSLSASAAVVQRYRESILPQAQRAAASVEYAYGRGAAALLDLLDARRALRATRLEQADAEYDYAAALVAWNAARERYAPPPR